MFLYLSELEYSDKFSFLLCKKPGSVYSKDNVEGRYYSPTTYAVTVSLDLKEMIKKLKEANSESYNSYQHEGVTPYSLNKAFNVLRTAMATDKYKDEDEEKLARTERGYSIVIGPFINEEEEVKEAFGFVGYTDVITQNTEYKVAHCYKITGKDTLATFLQKIFMISMYLTFNHLLYKLNDEQIEKYINLSKSWIDTKTVLFKRLVKNICHNNKELMEKYIKEVVEDSEEQEEVKSNLHIGYKSLHKKRHEVIIEKILMDIEGKNEKYNIVDLGCADGRLTLRLRDVLKKNKKDFYINCYDISNRPFHITKRITEIKFNQMNIIYPNPSKIPSNVSMVILTEVIEHFDAYERKMLLQNIAEMFRPKKIIISTPNRETNEKLGMEPNTLRDKTHKIEFNILEYHNEVTETLSKFGYVPSSFVTFTKSEDELEEWVSKDSYCLSNDTFSIFTIYELKEEKENNSKTPTYHDSFYLPISDYEITSKEIQRGYSDRAFVENGKNIFYIAPTIPPVSYRVDPYYEESRSYLEYPATVFEYYRDRGITELVAENKYMGSRAHICLFKNKEIAHKMGFDTTIIINTRNGNRFFNDPTIEESFYNDVRDKLQYDVTILDAEIMPWSVKGGNLIRNKFIGVGETNAIVREMQGSIYYDNALSYLKSLSNYTDAGDPYAVVFGVLAVGDVAGSNFSWKVGNAIDNLVKHEYIKALTGKCFKEVKSTYVNLDSRESMDEEIFDWKKYCGLGGEGKVYKPINTFEYTPAGYLIQPMMKVRGAEYLRIIYGMDYLEPEIFSMVKERNTKLKRLQAIQETELSNMILVAFMHRRKELRYKFIASMFGNENVNFSNIDRTL